jgi:hypothetical protein
MATPAKTLYAAKHTVQLENTLDGWLTAGQEDRYKTKSERICNGSDNYPPIWKQAAHDQSTGDPARN